MHRIAYLMAMLSLGLCGANTAEAQPSNSVATGGAHTGIRAFHANMNAGEEVEVTPSKGSGTADFQVDLATLKVTYAVTFKDLSSDVTGVQLHGPIPMGNNAPEFLNVLPKPIAGTSGKYEGSGQLTESQLQYMLIHEAYINVSTRKFPQGELRGQLDRVRDQPQ